MTLKPCVPSVHSLMLHQTKSGTGILTEQADSIILAAHHSGTLDRTLFLIDSFENCGRITPLRADMRRAMVYCTTKGDQTEGNKYLKKVCDRCRETGKEPRIYAIAAISLASYMQANSRYEEALKIAMPAMAKIENDPSIPSDRKFLLLSIIGSCQSDLKLYDESEKTFDKVYESCKKYMTEDYNSYSLRDMMTALHNIMVNHNDTTRIQGRKKWIDRNDSVLAWFKSLPEPDSIYIDRPEGGLFLEKANYLLSQHKDAEAAKAYSQFLKTDYSKTHNARINDTSEGSGRRPLRLCAHR